MPNTSPITLDSFPDISVNAGGSGALLFIHPEYYFTDSDEDTLTYTVTTARLDGSDSYTETLEEYNIRNYDLIGSSEIGVGDWIVTVTASDGLATVDQSFAMTIGHSLSVDQKIIDSIYVNEFQSNVALADGGFVVTLASGEQDDLDPASYGGGILAQIYNADGTTRGSEFTVNTFTQHSQEDPSIAALTDGGFVVAWVFLLKCTMLTAQPGVLSLWLILQALISIHIYT